MKKSSFLLITLLIPVLFGCNKDDDSNKDGCCFFVYSSAPCDLNQGGTLVHLCVNEDEFQRITLIVEESQDECVFIIDIDTTEGLTEGYLNDLPECIEFDFNW